MFTLMSNQITPSPPQNEIQQISGGQHTVVGLLPLSHTLLPLFIHILE